MAYERRKLEAPLRHEGMKLKRSHGEGVWWDRGDGLQVRIAAPEREQAIERTRLSVLGMLLALMASGDRRR